jgi:hypothetical protein
MTGALTSWESWLHLKICFDTGDKTLRLNLSGDFHRQLAKLVSNSVVDDFLNGT